MVRTLVLITTLCAGITSCVCEGPPPYSLSVVVYDADLLSHITADSIRLTATDGDFVELHVFRNWDRSLRELPIDFVEDRPGDYDVWVEVDGYHPLLLEGVRVRNEGIACRSVKTVTVQAPIVRLEEP